MTSETLRAALSRAIDTVGAAVERGALAESGRLVAAHLGTGPFLIVADENTWAVAGEPLVASLREAGCEVAEPLVFPGQPALYASYDNCLQIQRALTSDDAATASPQSPGTHLPIALGSGTINDLVKLAAFELGRDYAVVGTAASMDGYTGAGAPMTENGVKATRNCKAPVVVIMDLDVVAAAPPTMTASGYGDLVAKIPGGADWILAHHTGVEPIDRAVWDMVQSGVATALSRPAELAAGNVEAFSGLVEGLCLSGLAMQAYDGTRPASGAEHYFAHLWEIEGLGADRNPPLSHGFKVAVGSLAMCAFYEALLARDLTAIDLPAAAAARAPWSEIEADIRSRFTGALADHAARETRAKYAAGDELVARLQPLLDRWPAVVDELRAQLVTTAELSTMLREAGAPSRPEDIGVTRDDVRTMFPKAMFYRSRYTALDVAWELGIFDDLVADVFDSIWSK
ncbi:sn-glycerol-1-phosphate dehydrogenase [Tessaracoccus sp. MC1756]|uniref:sn-glycerol-1-phosphate dehydrogenase n=1 Tax=Tessaracoccus sp. MC1756 TaxID=2760311 RepID=UPI0016000571|nr:sn-glycerol-1-phosphate dehydrogenase [Tessaracoccus sp. MC1756]